EDDRRLLFFFQAEDGIRDKLVTGVQSCALPISRIVLSPSDLTAYLACEHLTTLSIRAARGEIERPEEVTEQAQLLFDKGLAHERSEERRVGKECGAGWGR